MKHLNYIFLLLIAVNCKAQSPIINIRNYHGEDIINSYLKDTNYDLDAFEGTYIFNSGDTIFKIKLKKIIKARTSHYYEDLLIGEIEFKIGNTTLLNTLPQLNTIYFNQYKHLINGNSILENYETPDCPDCVPNEIRVRLSIYDTRYASAFFVKRTMVNGTPALKVFKQTFGSRTKLSGTVEQEPIIRDGDYIFIKQP